MNKYFGPIKTKRQAENVARKLDGSTDQKHIDAAAYLRRSWQAVAARPEVAADLVKLADDYLAVSDGAMERGL